MTTRPELLGAEGFLVEVIRTRRQKTICVKVSEGKVSVAVPASLPAARIEALVAGKTRWIREKLRLQRDAEPLQQKVYASGERFSYLGRRYRLEVEAGRPVSVALRQGRLRVCVPAGGSNPAKLRQALVDWYRGRAQQKLVEKVEHYADVIGVTPAAVGIRSYKSRWGSCDNRGRVQFNWKIIMAPERVVDYLVVHELCHLRHHNHSPRFWKCVASVIPEYRECSAWLKQRGRLLEI